MERTSDKICASVPERDRPRAVELCENVLFMERKLAEARRNMENQQIVIAYDNGGGQRGIRKNPMFDSYNALMRTYNASLAQLVEILGATPSDLPARGKLIKFNNDKYRRVQSG